MGCTGAEFLNRWLSDSASTMPEGDAHMEQACHAAEGQGYAPEEALHHPAHTQDQGQEADNNRRPNARLSFAREAPRSDKTPSAQGDEKCAGYSGEIRDQMRDARDDEPEQTGRGQRHLVVFKRGATLLFPGEEPAEKSKEEPARRQPIPKQRI